MGTGPADRSYDFVQSGADLGVLLLLFMLALAYSGEELQQNSAAAWRPE